MDSSQVKSYYQTIIEEKGISAKALRQRIFQVGTLRLVVFLATILLCYLIWGQATAVIFSAAVGIGLFLALLVYHNKLFRQKDYLESQIQLASNELKGLEYDYSAFDGAVELSDRAHSFSLDLDLFGERSIFQSFNRTVTSQGKSVLSDYFMHPLDDVSDIRKRQEAVMELAQKPDLMLHFRTLAVAGLKEADKEAQANQETLPTFKNQPFWELLTWIVPVGYAILLILSLCHFISGNLFVPLWFVTMFISLFPSKKIKALTDYFQKGKLISASQTELLQVIENETFSSDLLKEIKSKITEPERASEAFSRLKKMQANFELSFTFPTLLIFNPYLLWNIRYAIAIQKWFKNHASDIAKWQETVAHFDALISLATYAFNHPDFALPLPDENAFFEGKSLGHPLIKPSVSVKNDAIFPTSSFFLVVTGANMAGKSTFLRTVGVNHLLACIGSVVCANSLTFAPTHLVTNLRTSDSLNDNESYFFAELKRLKMIIDRLQSGEKLFIILDEILKGTNSIDKRKGSLALMRQLISLNGNGIIATHDLELGALEKDFPSHVKNYCFEAVIEGNQLSFPYSIREGIAQNMNATFLMKQMGITGLE